MPPETLSARTLSSLRDIAAETWDAFANPPGAPFNPFVSHAFLLALETSGSAIAETGWLGQHIVLENGQGETLGLMPCYLKSHSRGEYVFDQGWAEAFEHAGGNYYPKLQVSVPFTPATGPRFLVKPGDEAGIRKNLLGEAARALCDKIGTSSVHITFAPEEDIQQMVDKAWLRRTDTQFHWHNQAFDNFDGFLAALSSRKRKTIRKERRDALGAGLKVEALTGSDIGEHHLDHFFGFYQHTSAHKWGSPYLTRTFFSLIVESMAEHVLLIMVKNGERYIAGALNFIGGDALYGRNWGAVEHHPCLHFEVCYYRAIDFAIERKLARVEAGAQGPHKLARGYLPQTTHSLHYLAHPGLAAAVDHYLESERAYVADNKQHLARHTPFRRTAETDEDGF